MESLIISQRLIVLWTKFIILHPLHLRMKKILRGIMYWDLKQCLLIQPEPGIFVNLRKNPVQNFYLHLHLRSMGILKNTPKKKLTEEMYLQPDLVQFTMNQKGLEKQ